MSRHIPRRAGILLHHTAEGRIGVCAEDDPHPPVVTLADCLRRDGIVEDEE